MYKYTLFLAAPLEGKLFEILKSKNVSKQNKLFLYRSKNVTSAFFFFLLFETSHGTDYVIRSQIRSQNQQTRMRDVYSFS